MESKPKVLISCLVYNHEPFLRDCLNGFVMQRTNFPFKVIVHDDCSTDSSASIIREYAEMYPDIIEPIYEKENLYSKKDGSLRKVMRDAFGNRGDYHAICEGDDYWTDADKLQKQVDYLDNHPDCTLIYTSANVETPEGIISAQDWCKKWGTVFLNDSYVNTEYVIEQGAAAIHTCTIMYRSNLLLDYPREAIQCYVGDYPLVIFAALKGNVFRLNDVTSVYRYCSIGSWTFRERLKASPQVLDGWCSLINMLKAMNEYSKKRYEATFRRMSVTIIINNLMMQKHLIPLACKKKVFMGLFEMENFLYFVKKPSLNWLQDFILKLKYYPFYPYDRQLNLMVSEISLYERILIALNYILKFRLRKNCR